MKNATISETEWHTKKTKALSHVKNAQRKIAGLESKTYKNKPNNLLLFCIIYGFGVNNIRIKAKGD